MMEYSPLVLTASTASQTRHAAGYIAGRRVVSGGGEARNGRGGGVAGILLAEGRIIDVSHEDRLAGLYSEGGWSDLSVPSGQLEMRTVAEVLTA